MPLFAAVSMDNVRIDFHPSKRTDTAWIYGELEFMGVAWSRKLSNKQQEERVNQWEPGHLGFL